MISLVMCTLVLCVLFRACTAAQPQAEHGVVCRLADLENAGKRQRRGGWAIEPRCTAVDLRDFVVDAEIEGRTSLDNGKPLTGAHVLERLLSALEVGAQLGTRITSLNLVGCALRDSDVHMLARVLAEDTDARRSAAVRSRGNARSRRVRQSSSSNANDFVFSNLKELHLERNQLGDIAMQLLVRALEAPKKNENNPTHLPVASAAHNVQKLRLINVRHNKLGLGGVSALLLHTAQAPESRVDTVDVRNNPAWADRALLAPLQPAGAGAGTGAGVGAEAAAALKATHAVAGEADAHLWWLQHYDRRSSKLRVRSRETKLLTGPMPVPQKQRGGVSVSASGVESKGEDRHSALNRERALAIVMMERARMHLSPAPAANPATPAASAAIVHKYAEGKGKHEDDLWNTADHAKDRQDKHATMTAFLDECYGKDAGIVDMDMNTDALASTFYRFGHGAPYDLLNADYDDLHAHLSPPFNALQIRLLLRCVCEFNYYFQEVALTERRAASEHHTAETTREIEDRQRTDEYLKVQGLSRINAQKQKNIHSDIDDSRSHSTNSHSPSQRTNSKSSGRNGERNEDNREVQYTMKREHADGRLDYTGQAGLASGVKLCESQYFRKAHQGSLPARSKTAGVNKRSSSARGEL